MHSLIIMSLCKAASGLNVVTRTKPKCNGNGKWKEAGERTTLIGRPHIGMGGREGVLKSAKLLLLLWDIIAGMGFKVIPRSCRPRLVDVADVV